MARTKSKPHRPPRNYIGYFTLCQEIGGHCEDTGRGIAAAGIHGPAMHGCIVADLQSLRAFCDRAISAVNAAQAEWSKTAQEQDDGK